MSDLTKRGYRGADDRQHADTELALKRVRDDINATAAYTVGASASWAGTPPATIAEAIDRIAAYIAGAGHSTPVPE